MIMVADDGFMCRHCTTGGRFLHWLGYRDRNGVAVSEVKYLSSVQFPPSMFFLILPVLVLPFVHVHVLVVASAKVVIFPETNLNQPGRGLHPCEQQRNLGHICLEAKTAECKKG